MKIKNGSVKEKQPIDRSMLLILLVCSIIVFLLLTTQVSLRRSNYSLKVGDVSLMDITAPRTITFTSDILTEESRQAAEDNVSPIFLPADPTISRNQVQNLRYTFQFIGVVRADEYLTRLQKIAYINSLDLASFDESTIEQFLDMSADDWNTLQEESIRVLENVMQNSIRDTQVITEIENIPAMINYYISTQISGLVTTVVSRFVCANSLYSEELTQKAKDDARDAVQPRERTYVANQTVIQKGQIVTSLIYEALDKMGLVQSSNNAGKFIAVLCIIAGALLFIFIGILDSNTHEIVGWKNWLWAAVLFVLYFVFGRLITPNHTVLPYLFPAPGLGLTIACLFGQVSGSIFALILAMLLPFDFSNAGVLSVYYILMSLSMIIIIGKGRQIGSFLKTGAIAGLTGIPVAIAYQFISSSASSDSSAVVTISLSVFGCGMLSGILALLFHFLISGFIGITTPTKLMELLRPDSPLLQYLLQNAPGTYQHCLQVANLAEQAARDIGADSLLTRAGAMYHDVGKAKNPQFFVENQMSNNLNLHNDMTPQESAAIILNHVTDGAELVKEYGLPSRIEDFVLQHHGTNITRYQYAKAVQLYGEENVDINDFRYKGPAPTSKETALVMFADTVEARARAEHPGTPEEIHELVKDVFNLYTTAGQIDNTPLTMKDLSTARGSFERVLQNMYHQRMRYPDAADKNSAEKPAIPPADPQGVPLDNNKKEAECSSTQKN